MEIGHILELVRLKRISCPYLCRDRTAHWSPTATPFRAFELLKRGFSGTRTLNTP